MSNHQQRPFNVQYVVPAKAQNTDDRLIERTATANFLYINRADGVDRFGPMTRWSARTDLVDRGRVGPQRADHPAIAGIGLWNAMDVVGQHVRPAEAIMAHAVASLPVNEDAAYWRNLAVGFAEDFFVGLGMIVDWAIHSQPASDERPEILPHCHFLVTTRVFDPESDRFGRRQLTWLRTPNACKAMGDRWSMATGIYPPGVRPLLAV